MNDKYKVYKKRKNEQNALRTKLILCEISTMKLRHNVKYRLNRNDCG